MTPEQIFDELKTRAPSICFAISREEDSYFSWDGDGPDPRDDGYTPYNVDVEARAIENGEVRTGRNSLGGSYYKPEEPLGDVHGYLPQMLEEAAEELCGQLSDASLRVQARAAQAFLNEEMQRRYDAQSRVSA
jgi:hypothetical protein